MPKIMNPAVINLENGKIQQYTPTLAEGMSYISSNAFSVTTDDSGNIYMTGYTNGDLDGYTNSGSNDIFSMKHFFILCLQDLFTNIQLYSKG